jgi:hypothetical protein
MIRANGLALRKFDGEAGHFPSCPVSRLADREARQAKQARGYAVTKIGEGERILATAITQQFTLRADGELEPATAESTCPIAQTVRHAGIVG